MEQNSTKVYVDIHSLLEVRQGILALLMEKEALFDYINSDEYNFRDIDIFPVDMEEYNRIKKEANINILQNSMVTYIVELLKTKLFNMEKRNGFMGESKPPEIILNIYPFDLSEKQCEIIKSALFVKLEIECRIDTVFMKESDLTPYFIKNSGIAACFIYDVAHWLDLHLAALDKTKMPELLIYGPSLYKQKDKEKLKDIDEVKKLGFKDLFSYLEFFVMSAVGLSFLPVSFYSNIITSKKIMDRFTEEASKTSLAEEYGVKDVDISTAL